MESILLAVACLIEARLGTKAFVYGDITRGQCRKAVAIANKFLDDKIEMPDCCDADRFMKRVDALELSTIDKMQLFEQLYLGTKDGAFGETVRKYFPKEILDDYWEKRFQHYKMGSVGFHEAVNEYLLWGFEIDALCQFVDFQDDDGNTLYEKFVIRIMDAKLHRKEKNCDDPLKIFPEGEQPYGIWTLFAGAGNKKVDRYVPIEEIEEIRAALKKGLKDKCDVDAIIDEYLKKRLSRWKLISRAKISQRNKLSWQESRMWQRHFVSC